MATTLKTASVLAFERKLDPSDALFFSGDWNKRYCATDWAPLPIREKSVRGTISNRLKTKDQDPIKLDAAIEKPNLQTVDICALPANADTLKVIFSLRILEGTGQPSACNSPAYQDRLTEVVSGYGQEHGFKELARRYACNLANGRFLWRNRLGAEEAEIHIAHLENGEINQSWTFSALHIPLRSFVIPDPAKKDVDALGELISQGLRGERHVLLEITAFVRIGKGLEVYPSQELIMERGRGDKSKTLYAVENVAAIHSQKIGNAIRTIDTWYPDAAEVGPIAIEPYGAVTTQGKAYRQPKEKTDFYSLLDNWMIKNIVPETDQQHFVMAVLVRGGVFGEA